MQWDKIPPDASNIVRGKAHAVFFHKDIILAVFSVISAS